MKRPISSIVLITLVLFLAVGAIPSGVSMILDPTGAIMGLPIRILESSPFSNFLFPGLFLTFVLGVLPLVVLYGLITKKEIVLLEKINLYKEYHWALGCSYFLGIVLILWINMQLYFGIGFHILHFSYSFLGLLIIFFAHSPGNRTYYLKNQ